MIPFNLDLFICFIYFNTVQIISRRVVGRAEETSTYSSLGFCTVNCRPTASNYQLSHLRPCRGSNPGLRGGRRECYHSTTVAPHLTLKQGSKVKFNTWERFPGHDFLHLYDFLTIIYGGHFVFQNEANIWQKKVFIGINILCKFG